MRFGYFVIGFLFPILAVRGVEIPAKDCVTVFAPKEAVRAHATPQHVLLALSKLKKKDGTLLFQKFSSDLEEGVKTYFGADPKTSSRLEQFYALLYLIGRDLRNRDDDIDLDIESARSVLNASQVFPTPQLVNAMKEVSVEWRPHSQTAEWEIKLSEDETVIPLNDGRGFKAYNHGFCQQVQKLHLYGGFHVSLSLRDRENIFVKFRDPVDFSGSFGSRGVADVEVSYVSLYDIEFHHGSKLGTSRCKIAQREFDTTDHSWFLRMVSGLISDKSTQVIDW